MTRPDVHEYFLRMAHLVATRATCLRRAVGCVLVDEKNRVLATGYNGVAAGLPHCSEGTPCDGAEGRDPDACQAIHAEANAVVQCRDPDRVHTAYVTVSPCLGCVKLLLGTGCQRVVFAEPHLRTHEAASALWLRGRPHVGSYGRPRPWLHAPLPDRRRAVVMVGGRPLLAVLRDMGRALGASHLELDGDSGRLTIEAPRPEAREPGGVTVQCGDCGRPVPAHECEP